MVKRVAYILVLFLLPGVLYSQQKLKIEIPSNKEITKEKREVVKSYSDGFVLKESILDFELVEENTKEGAYSKIIADGMNKTYDAGKPDLPVYNRLIDIPYNSELKIKILSYDEEIISLPEKGLKNLIVPAQPSYEKSRDIKDQPFVKDKEIYTKNEFYTKDIITFEDKGYLRDKHIGYIEISPFAYNPVTNVLKVITNIELEIQFIPKKVIKQTKSLYSPYFTGINYNTINNVSESKGLVDVPVKYVIVSDPMFQETLQPFVEWKKLKGFNVVEAYTDNIGTTTTDIKNYLQDQYENPSDGVSPTFVLLVGDVAQIPTFSGTAGGHKTDLYYFEYTGDKLPEVFYGRFSAETVQELQSQVNKTLEVEKFQMPDPGYLENVVLVAGVDGSYASKWGNGAINYANSYYTNEENDVTSYYYLYNDDSGVMASNNSGASASIRSYISGGVSFANYTAHCGISGWSDPSFNTSHIDELTNEHMYPLLIGNCCESNTFYSNDCFGEQILIAENKGAVGYIGGSNLTYWDEDYYWGIGLTSTITANPTYENSGLGAYDRFFHLNGEAKEDWYVTQGQIVVAGNLAVEASTSGRKAYYWEIYHLMGDPSLTPYVSVPEQLVASYNTEVIEGAVSYEIITEEDAYAAISYNGDLLDVKRVGETGLVILNCEELPQTGTFDLVITKQNRQPIIDEIEIIPATTPYVILDKYYIDDTGENNNGEVDFGETISLDIQLKNVANNYDAFNVIANLNSTDTNIVITDNTENFGTILKADSSLIEASFMISFKNKFKNEQKVNFEIDIDGKDSENNEYEWNSKLTLTVNSAELEIGDLLIDDNTGNSNEIIDPGENADILLVVKNNGNAAINNLNGIISILGDDGYLTLNDTETGNFLIEANSVDTIAFNVSADVSTPVGSYVYLNLAVKDIYNDYYSKSVNKEIYIGEIPEILISHEDTVLINNVKFYDSGGKSSNYSDYEEYTITFKPEDSNKFISANFDSFSVESEASCDYDKLSIYNGMSALDELVGYYCGGNSPGLVTANNVDGALTFVFTSDESVNKSGWEATIRSYLGYSLQINVQGPEGNIEDAVVEFAERTDTTDSEGNVFFDKLPDGINYFLSITAEGYDTYETLVNIYQDTTFNFTLEREEFDVTFSLADEDGAVEGDVTFDGKTLSTTEGSVSFTNVVYSLSKEFNIQSFGHEDSTATIQVTSDITENIVLKTRKYNVEFVISDGVDPVQDAVVELNSLEASTNIDGIALFEQVKMDTSISYMVRKTGFTNLEGELDLEEDTTVNLVLNSGSATFKVTFRVSGEAKTLYNAEVVLGTDTLYTDAEGIATFKDVAEGVDIPYKISKIHFNDIEDYIDVSGENVVVDTTMTYKSYEIIFSVDDGTDPIENAIVSFDGKSGSTDTNGECSFDVTYALNKPYSISKEGYSTSEGMINVDENKTIDASLERFSYNVTFNVYDESLQALGDVLVQFNTESKYTNDGGSVAFSGVYPGDNLNFTLSKDGYLDYDSSLNVVDKDEVFNAYLTSAVGISTVFNEKNLKIYPNPSNGIFNIEINDSQRRSYQLKVFDVIGSIHYQKEITSVDYFKGELDLTHKSKGIYFLSVESDDGIIISKRIIIK